MRLLAALAAVLTLTLAGEASATSLAGTLRYERSGGFAGTSESLTLKRDGRATFTADRGRRTVRLKAAERERVARLVRAADLATVKVRKAPVANDAFEYALAYRGRALRFTDTNFPVRLQSLVNALANLVDKYMRPRR